jgi:hypothetical protein
MGNSKFKMQNSKLLGFSGLVVCWIMMVLTCNIAFAQNGQASGVKPSERVIPANAPRVRGEVEQLFKRNRIDSATISTEGDYVAELIKLFKQR